MECNTLNLFLKQTKIIFDRAFVLGFGAKVVSLWAETRKRIVKWVWMRINFLKCKQRCRMF